MKYRLGLKHGEVRLLSYDPRWKKEFEKEQKILEKILGTLAKGIEHTGSTAIPGLVAKPIIDVAVGPKSIKEARKIVKKLEKAKYVHRVNFFRPDQHYLFSKINGRQYTTHHIHVIKYKGTLWKRMLIFPDYLRKYSRQAKQYGKLKINLQKSFKNDRRSYTKAKKKFVTETEKLASLKNQNSI